MSIVAEKVGTYYLPNFAVTDIRVQKEFVIKNTQRLRLMFNVFNFFDDKTVTSVYQGTSTSFGSPSGKRGEGVVRFSWRYTF